jgi:tetratricopeptide (TPR) repeat protein
VVLKALEKDRKRRYGSPSELAADLGRYLRNEPVSAHPPSAAYRARKYVRRHQVGVAVAAAAVLLLAGFAVTEAIQLRRITRERDRADRIKQFMLNIMGASDQNAAPSTDLRVVTLLDHGVQEAGSLSPDPDTQSDLYENLGNMYDMLGEFPKAEKLLMLALDRRKNAPSPDDVKIAGILVRIGAVKADEGVFDEAEKYVQQGLDLASRRLPANHPQVLAAKSELGTVITEYGDFRRAMPLLEPLVQRQPSGNESDYSLSESLSSLAICEYSIGKIDLSDSLVNRSLDLDRRLFGPTHPQVASDLITAGMIKAAQSRDQEAENDYRQGIEIERAWYGSDHPMLADYELLLAAVLVDEGKDAEAEGLLRHTIQVYQRVYSADDGHLAKPLYLLGKMEMNQGQLSNAETDLARAVALALPVYGADGFEYAVFSAALGELYRREKRFDRADEILSPAVKALLINRSPDPISLATAQLSWGRTLLAMKRFSEAEKQISAAYQVYKTEDRSPLPVMQGIRQDLLATYTGLNQPNKVKAVQAEIATANAKGEGTAKSK